MEHKASMKREKADQKIDEGSSRESGAVRRTPPGSKQNSQGYRRKRTAFTVRQLERMQAVFQWNKYPGVNVREALATELGISEACIQVWFQNRRSKWRKRENNRRPTYREEQLEPSGERREAKVEHVQGGHCRWIGPDMASRSNREATTSDERDACSFTTYNTAERSWPLPQAHNYCSCQVKSRAMFGAPQATAALIPTGSTVNSRLITCASFYSTRAPFYGQDEQEAERIGQMSFMLKSDEAAPTYVDLDQSLKVNNEAIQGERSADEIIGANGLLCMRETSSSPFMSSNYSSC